MTAANIDPFESRSPARSAKPIDGVEIDAMLDRIDDVLCGRAAEGSRILDLSREESELAILSRLRDLAEDLARLRIIADDCGDPEAAVFAREARARIERLLARRSAADRSASGAIEVELDYERLHDFMLAPDLDRIPS